MSPGVFVMNLVQQGGELALAPRPGPDFGVVVFDAETGGSKRLFARRRPDGDNQRPKDESHWWKGYSPPL
jgi:hypothetical protein